MRESYQAARFLVGAYGDETARAWFNGSNARLDDSSSGLRASQGQELGGAAADRPLCPRVCGWKAEPLTPAVETRGVAKHYGSLVALESLTLTVDPGEVLGVLGPNGQARRRRSGC